MLTLGHKNLFRSKVELSSLINLLNRLCTCLFFVFYFDRQKFSTKNTLKGGATKVHKNYKRNTKEQKGSEIKKRRKYEGLEPLQA